jgi:signal transduction histidine kinase
MGIVVHHPNNDAPMQDAAHESVGVRRKAWSRLLSELDRATMSSLRLDRLDRASLVVGAALTIATLLFAASRPLRFAILAPELDAVLHTFGTVACVAVATLSYARFRETGAADGLFVGAAFLVLAAANLANLLAIVTGRDGGFGLRLDEPGQLPVYFWAFARLIAACLFALGAFAVSPMGSRWIRHPRVVLWVPTVALAIGCTLLWSLRDAIPILVDPTSLRQLADESFSSAPFPHINAGILILDGLAVILLLAAAAGYAWRSRAAPGRLREYLEVGLVIAAFSQLHFVLYPAVYTGLVSTGDVLRILFYLVVLAGTLAASRADMQALRTANARLQLLAASEADRTAVAERARLARELHDGLAQRLWTTKLEFDRLTSEVPDPGPDLAASLRRSGEMIDASLREAREAVEALRSGFDAGLSLGDELPRRLDAFADRTGYPVDMELDSRAGRLPGVYAADVLRIVEEALHNIQKHADATRIRVRLRVLEPGLMLSIDDNGRGFDPTVVTPGHGLLGMRERANLLGGYLEVESAPGDGTAVRLYLPDARLA